MTKKNLAIFVLLILVQSFIIVNLISISDSSIRFILILLVNLVSVGLIRFLKEVINLIAFFIR